MGLGWLLRSLLMREAQSRMASTVAEAVRQAAAEQAGANSADAAAFGAGQQASSSGEQDRPAVCDIAVIFALGIEAGPLEDRLGGLVATRAHGFVVRHSRWQGRHISVVRAGVGRQAAARATRAVITAHKPKWVVAAGLAGALSSRLAMGDVLMVDEIITPGEPLLRIDLRVERDESGQSGEVHVGRLLTVDKIVAAAEEKKQLAAEHDALAVDMETYAVASVCREMKTRCLAFRVISDAADQDLPPDVVRLANQRTWAGTLGAVSGALVRRPSSASDMLRLKAQANACGDRLAQFLLSAFERLP